MISPETLALYRRLIQQEIDCAERLADVMRREAEALGGRDAASLEQANVEKLELLHEMEQRSAAHEGFLAARGLPAGREGNLRFLRGLPADAEEHGLWRRLRSAAVECRDLNLVNGSLVALRRTRTQRALEILRGAPDSAKTYGKSGLAHNAARSQLIAQT